MKKTFLSFCLLVSLAVAANAQSDSFMALKSKFRGCDETFYFGSGGGLLARAALWASGEEKINDAVKRIHDIQLMVVPMDAFHEKQVTVAGYKRVLAKDHYAELARVKEHGDDVTIYIRPAGERNNLYLILVEQPDEVVAIHFEGYVDPSALLSHTDQM